MPQSRLQDVRSAVAAELATQVGSFSVPFDVVEGSLSFTDVDETTTARVYVAEGLETITPVTRVAYQHDYKIIVTVTSYLSTNTEELMGSLVNSIRTHLKNKRMAGCWQTTFADSAPTNEFESPPNEQRKYWQTFIEIEYQETISE